MAIKLSLSNVTKYDTLNKFFPVVAYTTTYPFFTGDTFTRCGNWCRMHGAFMSWDDGVPSVAWSGSKSRWHECSKLLRGNIEMFVINHEHISCCLFKAVMLRMHCRCFRTGHESRVEMVLFKLDWNMSAGFERSMKTHGWQLFSSADPSKEGSKKVCLSKVIAIDPWLKCMVKGYESANWAPLWELFSICSSKCSSLENLWEDWSSAWIFLNL